MIEKNIKWLIGTNVVLTLIVVTVAAVGVSGLLSQAGTATIPDWLDAIAQWGLVLCAIIGGVYIGREYRKYQTLEARAKTRANAPKVGHKIFPAMTFCNKPSWS